MNTAMNLHIFSAATRTADLQAEAVVNGYITGTLTLEDCPVYNPKNVCGEPQCINWEHWTARKRIAAKDDTIAERIALHGYTAVVRVPELGECHEFDGATDSSGGYARIRINGRGRLVHRLVLELTLERELTSDEFAMHRCDNPSCVRPEHIALGDHTANMRDASSKGRMGVPPAIKRGTGRELVEFYYGFGQSSYQIAAATGMNASHVRYLIRQIKAEQATAEQSELGKAA